MGAHDGSEIPIGAPPLQPPITGLLAQAPVIDGPEGERWIRGLAWSPESIEQPDLRDLCSTLPLDQPDLIERAIVRGVKPFELILRDRCSTFGFPTGSADEQDAYLVGRATRALDVKRHWGIEREFESGALITGNPHLAATYAGEPDPTTVLLAAGVRVSAVNALALLDEAIANSAAIIGRGMIHATAYVVNLWKNAGMLTSEVLEGDEGLGAKTQLYSPKGNLVIAGNGYQGRSPVDGLVPAAHGSQWAYATDWLLIVAGTPTTVPGSFAGAVDRARNLVVYQQHQWFSILWSGLLHAAVQVLTTTPTV